MRIKTRGFSKAIRDMEKRKALFSGQNPKLYNQSASIISQSVSKNFDAGGRPTWPKRTRTYSWPILVKTGAMKQKAVATANAWKKEGKQKVIHITSMFYGIFHQYKTKTRKPPVRKFVLLQASERKKIIDLFRKAFLRP